MESEKIDALVRDAIEILGAVGIPINVPPRRRTKMAKAFIAVCGLKPGDDWSMVVVNDSSHQPRSRDVIKWMNQHLGENISSGSYDDIRRKDLLYPVEAGLVLKSAGNESAATNDGTRGYALNPQMAGLIRSFATEEWPNRLASFLEGRTLLVDELRQRREMQMMPVNVNGVELKFGPGEHNQIQKAVIEEFLPRFGHSSEVIYVGDTENKALYIQRDAIAKVGFFDLKHDKLPDVLAYSSSKNWVYIVEAVHSANPIDPMRKQTFEKLAPDRRGNFVFVTAFLTRAVFRKFAADIAWETEVWIADEPDHMIHFNGDRFLGPHQIEE